jgi:hypothetical protein
MQEWVLEGKVAEAAWFSETYLHEDWNRWWVTSLIPGNIPNNNPLESSNRKDKLQLHKQQVSMNHFFDNTMEKILLSYRQKDHHSNICTDDQESYIVNHSIPRFILNKAKRFLSYGGIAVRESSSSSMTYFMNSTPNQDEVTAVRIERYLSQQSPDNVAAAVADYLSLNMITRTERPDGKAFYLCDCDAFMRSGIYCPHIVAISHSDEANSFSLCAKMVHLGSKARKKRKLNGPEHAADPASLPASAWLGQDILIDGNRVCYVKSYDFLTDSWLCNAYDNGADIHIKKGTLVEAYRAKRTKYT